MCHCPCPLEKQSVRISIVSVKRIFSVNAYEFQPSIKEVSEVGEPMNGVSKLAKGVEQSGMLWREWAEWAKRENEHHKRPSGPLKIWLSRCTRSKLSICQTVSESVYQYVCLAVSLSVSLLVWIGWKTGLLTRIMTAMFAHENKSDGKFREYRFHSQIAIGP